VSNRETVREKNVRRLDLLRDDADHAMPDGRQDCRGTERPCAIVRCRHNAYLDVSSKTNAIKLNFPDLEPWEVPPESSCTLDAADAGPRTLEEVAATMNLTRERVRQVEAKALKRLAVSAGPALMRDFADALADADNRAPSLLDQSVESDVGDGGGLKTVGHTKPRRDAQGLTEADWREVDLWANEVAANVLSGMPIRAAQEAVYGAGECDEPYPVVRTDRERGGATAALPDEDVEEGRNPGSVAASSPERSNVMGVATAQGDANRKAILAVIAERGSVKRSDIVGALQMSVTTIRHNLGVLKAEGAVRLDGTRTTGRWSLSGRSPVLLGSEKRVVVLPKVPESVKSREAPSDKPARPAIVVGDLGDDAELIERLRQKRAHALAQAEKYAVAIRAFGCDVE